MVQNYQDILKNEPIKGKIKSADRLFTSTVLYVGFPLAGSSWYHISAPAKQKLKQVSVGKTSVYTVDENGKASARLIILVCQ